MSREAAQSLAQLAERIWQRQLTHDVQTRARLGLSIDRIPLGTFEERQSDAAFALIALRELDALSPADLGHSDVLTHAFLRDTLERWRERPYLWWGQFPVTPYVLLGHSAVLQGVFSHFDFAAPDANDRYQSLVVDYGRCVDHLLEKLKLQAGRGWRIPKPALPGVRGALTALRQATRKILPVPAQQLNSLNQRVQALMTEAIEPAFDRLFDYLQGDYARSAPETVGMWQYTGGEEMYRRWVRYHATYDAEPNDIYQQGLAAVEELAAAMESLRGTLGFHADTPGFLQHLETTGRLYARTPEEVESRYRTYMSRMAGQVDRYFSTQPRAPYGVARLDPSMEAGLSFGFYERPTPTEPVGRYRYNGSGLDARPQISAAALIFHEVVPGHHFQLARQAENQHLAAIRRESLDNTAYVEGWAEYASDLAHELGLYKDPYDAYGRLVLDRFAAQRLVLDIGLNLHGWTLERAQAYMKANTLEPRTQIVSETLRYSTDLPGQALTYRLGLMRFKALRELAQQALGPRFDIRAYHETILDAGALPLSVLESHVRWFIEKNGL
ncbi:MAG: DUF885 domain-containing protein [Proteobacteria bacterium]|nr:DUF885 domain-containing protein [Pseudomonadota bacterium]